MADFIGKMLMKCTRNGVWINPWLFPKMFFYTLCAGLAKVEATTDPGTAMGGSFGDKTWWMDNGWWTPTDATDSTRDDTWRKITTAGHETRTQTLTPTKLFCGFSVQFVCTNPWRLETLVENSLRGPFFEQLGDGINQLHEMVWYYIMWARQCHKPTHVGMGIHTTIYDLSKSQWFGRWFVTLFCSHSNDIPKDAKRQLATCLPCSDEAMFSPLSPTRQAANGAAPREMARDMSARSVSGWCGALCA